MHAGQSAAAERPRTIAESQATTTVVRAVRLDGEIALDGRFTEVAWEHAPAFSSFVQQVPKAGSPATERTEVRILYDDEAIYIGVRAYQSRDVPIVSDELRRDAGRMHVRNDTFTVALDTFGDGRNGYLFIFNALGAVADWAGWDEGRIWSQDWDAVWDVRTAREDWGWAAEMRLPFLSVRFRAVGEQRWGITLRRVVLAKNEWAYSTAIRPEWGEAGIGRFSSAARLEGLHIARRTMNLEITPAVVAGGVEDECVTGCVSSGTFDASVDAKYGLTSNLTLDLTWNTDFSQVEADEQQLNFTRFSLFFPEKRRFFLEGKGIFDFGITTGDYRLLPFFSRRIGLEASQTVPILGGARMTGKAGRYSIGALAIGTDEAGAAPATAFHVVRVKRDILRRSTIGFIATDRRGGGRENHAVGADASLSLGRITKVDGFIARAWSPSQPSDAWSGRIRAIVEADRWTAEVDYVNVGRHFNPEAGYVRRRDVDRWFGRLQASPRPARGPVRKVYAAASLDYARDGGGRLESRDLEGLVKFEFHSADLLQVTATRGFDAPARSFPVAGGLRVPAGAYAVTDVAAAWTLSPKRRAAGVLTVRSGGYYGGRRREFTASSLLFKTGAHFSADVNYQVTDVTLPAGEALTQLFGIRVNHSLNTRLYSSTLLQWNTATSELTANARVVWMYRPGSHLYVVFARSNGAFDAPIGLLNQSLVVKVTRLLRF